MSLNLISKSSFSLNSLNENAYELSIQFFNEKGESVSDKKFTFSKEKTAEEEKVWDVLTKNGKCSPHLLKNLFQKKDVEEAQNAASKLSATSSSGPLLCVLDLKEAHHGYLPCTECDQTIAHCEEEVCQFFQKKSFDSVSNHAKKIHSLFQNGLPLNFILCEGSLKMDLLQHGGFTDPEIAYFQETSLGKVSFCQCAEFFMNGFKFGQIARSQNGYFQSEKYFKSLTKEYDAFVPCKTSMVFYPLLYKNIYSPDGEFASVLKSVFSVSGEFDESHGITTWNVEKKS